MTSMSHTRCGHCGVGGVLLLRFLNRRALVLQVHAPVLNTISQGGFRRFFKPLSRFFRFIYFRSHHAHSLMDHHHTRCYPPKFILVG